MSVRNLVLDSLLAVILLIVQATLAFLPNIELVSLLLILYTLLFRRRVYLIVFLFVMLEGILYGFGLWWFSYLYVWPLLCLITHLMRNCRSTLIWALVSCLFGLSFGLLCAASYLFMGGIGAALTWWIAGIPFDLIHGVSNFILTMILFQPLYRLLSRLNRNY